MPNILRNAVQLAAQKFEEYHNIHMSKSIPDISKALANAKLARTMREALIQCPEVSDEELRNWIQKQMKYHTVRARDHYVLSETERGDEHNDMYEKFSAIAERLSEQSHSIPEPETQDADIKAYRTIITYPREQLVRSAAEGRDQLWMACADIIVLIADYLICATLTEYIPEDKAEARYIELEFEFKFPVHNHTVIDDTTIAFKMTDSILLADADTTKHFVTYHLLPSLETCISSDKTKLKAIDYLIEYTK